MTDISWQQAKILEFCEGGLDINISRFSEDEKRLFREVFKNMVNRITKTYGWKIVEGTGVAVAEHIPDSLRFNSYLRLPLPDGILPELTS